MVRQSFQTNERLPLRVEYRHFDGPARLAFKWTPPPPEAGFADALAAAKSADAVIFVGGISASLEGEEMASDLPGFKGGDRTAIELPAVQQALLQQLQATGKPVIFVNLSGSAIAMPWVDEHVNAILQAWYPGQAGGTAVADVLLGQYNPAGRLPVTFYRATADLPAFENYDMAGRTYRYFKGKPLYAFGHGLSYTKFDFNSGKLASKKIVANGTAKVTFTVKNAGKMDGDEVAQVYFRHVNSAVPQPKQALCGFARVSVKSGKSSTVTIEVPAERLRYWDAEKKQYVVEPGDYEILVGAASDDIRLKLPMTIAGQSRPR